jgi:hypothetical protein
MQHDCDIPGLLKGLDQETRWHSSPFAMRETDAFRALLAEGPAIVPDLIEALPSTRSPMAFMALLSDLTGERPPRAIRGRVTALIEWWVALRRLRDRGH